MVRNAFSAPMQPTNSTSLLFFYGLSWILISCSAAFLPANATDGVGCRTAKMELNSLALNLESSFSTVCVQRPFYFCSNTVHKCAQPTLGRREYSSANRWNIKLNRLYNSSVQTPHMCDWEWDALNWRSRIKMRDGKSTRQTNHVRFR